MKIMLTELCKDFRNRTTRLKFQNIDTGYPYFLTVYDEILLNVNIDGRIIDLDETKLAKQKISANEIRGYLN